jgi:hypothetical protein
MQHGLDLLGVVLPVGSHVQKRSALHRASQLSYETVLDQAPLVVSFFRPGIGEEDVDRVEGLIGDHRIDDVDDIAIDDSNIRHARSLDEHEEMSDAWLMHLDADEVDLTVVGCHREKRLAVTEPDVEHARCGSAEHRRQVERLAGESDAPNGKEPLERARLSRCRAARPANEAADASQVHSGHNPLYLSELSALSIVGHYPGCRTVGRGQPVE